MRKLRVDLDDLSVESFATQEGARGHGTLFGHDSGTGYTDCWGQTCPDCGATALVACTQQCGSGQEQTCDMTCATCNNSCDGWHTCVYECWNPTSYQSCQNCPTTPQPCDE